METHIPVAFEACHCQVQEGSEVVFLSIQTRMRICNSSPIVLSLAVYLVQIVAAQVPTTSDSVCLPNPLPPTAEQLSAPFSTCSEDVEKSLAQTHPDQNKLTPEILETYGYPYKTYNVTTEDGYILTVYRITGSPNLPENDGTTTKQAVLLMHGLLLSSDCWNFQPGSRNLPFKLADAGYEVWLGNSRGTSYSLGHTKYNANTDLKYWDFSWHEMGMYDLPALTDKMLKESGNDQIFYIGHSQGTTQYFVSLSEIPEMNNKIRVGFMLAPVIFNGHMNNPSRYLFEGVETDAGLQVANALSGGRVPTTQQLREKFNVSTGDFCDLSAAKCGACDNFNFMLFGYDAPQINNTELPNYFAKFPNSASLKQAAHNGQTASSCSFRKYNYGAKKNLAIYKRLTPPAYKLENIKAPMFLIHADHDNFSPPNDVNITVSKLSPGVVKGIIRINDSLFNHMDFVMAKDADTIVYNHILEEMQKFQ